ncbi:MAG: DUF998 domain-containing protein [Telluria sp.]
MLNKLVFATAILGALTIVLLTLIGGAMFPGYRHAAQFISELGAHGAPHATVVNYAGFLPAGILICSFAVLAWKALPRSVGTTCGMVGIALFGFGYIVATFYPCEAGCRPAQVTANQVVHNVLGLAGYVTAPLALALLGWQARRWTGASMLVALGFTGAVFALIGLMLLSPEFAYVGIAQRVLEASVLSWVVACGFYVNIGPR